MALLSVCAQFNKQKGIRGGFNSSLRTKSFVLRFQLLAFASFPHMRFSTSSRKIKEKNNESLPHFLLRSDLLADSANKMLLCSS